MDVPLPSLLPGIFPTTNSMLRFIFFLIFNVFLFFSGSGILYWLSSKAGLINCSKPVHATVSFQIKVCLNFLKIGWVWADNLSLVFRYMGIVETRVLADPISRLFSVVDS